jgi:hypothetical protein
VSDIDATLLYSTFNASIPRERNESNGSEATILYGQTPKRVQHMGVEWDNEDIESNGTNTPEDDEQTICAENYNQFQN